MDLVAELEDVKSKLQEIGRHAFRHKAVPSMENDYKFNMTIAYPDQIWGVMEMIGRIANEAQDRIDFVKEKLGD